jgi:hypothetical protein
MALPPEETIAPAQEISSAEKARFGAVQANAK